MRNRRLRITMIGAVAAAIVVGAVVVRFLQVAERRALFADGVPTRPEQADTSNELGRRIAACEQRIRNGQDAQQALGELGRLYHANGFYAEASHVYGRLMQLEPDNPQWPHLLATILAGFGQLEDAVPLWQRTVALAPDYAAASIRLGDILAKQNRGTEAAAAYQVVRQHDADNPYAMIGLARLDVAAERWSAARSRLESAVAQSRRVSAGDLLATVYDRLGESDLAFAVRSQRGAGERDFCDVPDPWVSNLLEACFDSTQLVIASVVAIANGDEITARRWLERAVLVNPRDASAHRQYGAFLVKRREFARARPWLEKSVTLGPEQSDNWVSLLSFFDAVGDQTAGDQTLDAGLSHCPNSPALNLEKGRRLKRAGRTMEALSAFAEARRLRPQEIDAYMENATIQFALGQTEAAVTTLREALAVVPEHPIALFLLTRYAIDHGEMTAAVDLLHRVHAQAKISPEDRASLASAFREQFGRAP